MRGALAGVLLAVALGTVAGAVEPASAPAPAGKASDQAVLDDIEKTLKGLSSHISVGSKRVRVDGPARPGTSLPGHVDLAVGSSMNVDLPGEAHEVVVGDAAIIDVATINSKRRLFIMGRKIGRSNVFVLDAAAEVIARVEVQVGVDGQSVVAAIRRSLPDDPIAVDAEGASLVLTGKVSSDAVAGRAAAIARRFVEKDEQVVNLLQVARDQQVLLQVRVAEVQKNILKEIGADTTLLDKGIFGAANITGRVNPQPSSGINPVGSFVFTGVSDLLLRLTLLENRGLVRNLAEPNLVAVSGETASMLAGGEVPIPVADDDGIKLEMKPFGVALSFLPVVLDSGRINLKLSTEVSARSDNDGIKWPVLVNNQVTSITIPGFTVRRAASTVELPDGGSLMIAGLLQNDTISGLSGVPGAMDVPVLGQLFRSDSFKRNETELVIFVSANLVKPAAAGNFVVPTDSMSPGGDLDMWLFGKMLGRYTPGFRQDRIRDREPAVYGFTIDEVLP